MIQLPRSLLVVPLTLVLVGIAGCGSKAATTATTATAGTTATIGPPATPGATVQPTIPPTPIVTGSVAAVVNGQSVPLSTYRLLLTLSQRTSGSQPGTTIKTLAKQTMDEVIFNELIQQYATAHHIVVTNAQLQAQEKTDEKSAGGAAAFNQKLAQYGLTTADYAALVRPNLLGRKVENVVTPAKPAHSQAAAKKIAYQVLAKLQHGGNFAALAKKYSQDPGSAAHGGDLGNVYPNQTVAPFDHAAFHAPLKQYVIVHSSFGYHVVEVLSRGKTAKPGSPASAPKVLSAHVRHILISTQPENPQAQQTQFLNWIHQQEKKATIKRVAQVKG